MRDRMSTARPWGVDAVVRLHDPARLYELDRALFSLATQSFTPVHAVIVAQNFDTAALARVRAAADALDWESHVPPTIVDVQDRTRADLRSTLLNRGIAAGRHRFLAFLDYDDFLYPAAYAHLAARLEATGAAISFGDIVLKDVAVYEDCTYALHTRTKNFKGDGFEDFLEENFCPIHSFLIDRAVVADDDLVFDDALTRFEDYDFLLRLAMKHEFDFGGRDVDVGVYCLKLDGSNTIVVGADSKEVQAAKRAEWGRARRHIWRVKGAVYARLEAEGRMPAEPRARPQADTPAPADSA